MLSRRTNKSVRTKPSEEGARFQKIRQEDNASNLSYTVDRVYGAVASGRQGRRFVWGGEGMRR